MNKRAGVIYLADRMNDKSACSDVAQPGRPLLGVDTSRDESDKLPDGNWGASVLVTRSWVIWCVAGTLFSQNPSALRNLPVMRATP